MKVFKVAVVLIGVLSGLIALAEPLAVDLQIRSTNELTRAQLSWTSDADTFYEIWTSTNLADQSSWSLATEDPIISSNLATQVAFFSFDKSRFFQVREVDTHGPVIVSRYPSAGDANVGLTAALSVAVSDPSGIDTNAFHLTINGGIPLSWDSAGVTITSSGFTFDPSLASTNWGVNGSTVTVTFACADIKSNATYETWSFYLAVPVTVANNILVLGSTPALSYSVAPLPNTAFRPLAANSRVSITSLSSELSIVAIYADRIVVSYTGDTHGISIGMLLANNDFDNIFYRKVTGLSDNQATKRVTVYTQDVPFTQLITQGSMDSGDFVWVGEESAQALSLSSSGRVVPLATFEKSLTYSQSGFYDVGMDWGPVSFLGSASFELTGGMFFSTEIQEMKVTQISAGVNASLDVALDASVTFDGSSDPVDESMPLLEDSIRLGQATAYIYGIPVRISLYLDLDLCVESDSSGSVTLAAGATANASFSYKVNYNRETQWTRTSDGSFTYSIPPVTLSGGMEGEAYVYVKPTLTVRLYEAVGVALDYCRGPKVTGSFISSDARYEFGLYDKRLVNLGIWCADLPEFMDGLIDTENLPSWELWSKETPILTWYWPEVPLSAPSFTKHPASGTYAYGATVTLSASASGNPAPSYQWYQNGTLLVGKTGQSIAFTMGSSSVGTYTCKATNSRGSVTSQDAVVALQTDTGGLYLVVDLSGGPTASSYPVSYLSGVPSGGWTDTYKTTKLVMRKIPKGTFTMGSPSGELGRYSIETQHQVTLTKDFYIGVFEVTQRQWELVMGNRPSYFNNSSYYTTRPVEQVSYYDIRENPANSDDSAVDWPNNSTVNASSFMGKLRAKTGLATFDLPTESQWEYACRAGTTTALNTGYNLTSASSDPRMDVAGRYWYNGGSGYSQTCTTSAGTAKVGSYLPNAWGLYDMHGNVWEWCLDWYGAYPGTVSDPSGSSSGSDRVERGGSWYYYTSDGRSARRSYLNPSGRHLRLGFRPVRTLP